MSEELVKEVERLTKERDVYKASWEQLTVEKAQSSWGEFQRQGKMLKEAQAEVERLTYALKALETGE